MPSIHCRYHATQYYKHHRFNDFDYMRNQFITILFIFIIPVLGSAQTRVSGLVRDRVSEEVLIGAVENYSGSKTEH